ncbi:MAG: creatininase family protein [Roseiflexaceae bacterium]|nr:creatininase family protein [Roseiflexaceae bacterium]
MSAGHSSVQLFHELTRDDLRAAGANALLILPVAAVEQHGPHLPVGTDWIIVEYVARAAAAAAAQYIPVIVAPTLPFGSSDHHLPFSGTMSFSTTAYYRLLVDIVTSLHTGGFRRMFILNGHGGDHEIIQLVARDMALRHPLRIGAASYWNIARERLIALDADHGQRLPGHAGGFESALMLALRPELVRLPLPSRAWTQENDPLEPALPFRLEMHGFWQAIDGYSDNPAQATAERGRVYLDAIVEAVTHAFLTFDTVTREGFTH